MHWLHVFLFVCFSLECGHMFLFVLLLLQVVYNDQCLEAAFTTTSAPSCGSLHVMWMQVIEFELHVCLYFDACCWSTSYVHTAVFHSYFSLVWNCMSQHNEKYFLNSAKQYTCMCVLSIPGAANHGEGKGWDLFLLPPYIYMLTCNLSGEEGSEEKPREGSWGIGCLCLLLGGLRFLTDRLQGQQQGRQKGNLLLQVQGQDQRQTGLQENARIDSHKLQQYVSKINFILSGQWWSSMEWWEAGGICWVILLICSIFTMWWFMLQLLLSQVAAGNVSADAVDSLAEAII